MSERIRNIEETRKDREGKEKLSKKTVEF